MHWFYAAVNLMACTAVIGASLLWLRPFWQHWRRMATAWLTVSGCWAVLDSIGVARDWWHYKHAYIFGYNLLGLPLEGCLTLLIVPLAGVLTLYALGQRITTDRYVHRHNAQRVLLLIAGVILFCVAAQMHKECTLIGALLALCVIVLLYQSSFIVQRVFWYWNGMMLLYCFVLGTVLSVFVTYSDVHMTGMYIGVVPLEYFLYTVSILNMFALVFRTKSLRSAYQTLLERRPRIMPMIMPKATHPSTYQNRPSDAENDTT